MVERPEPNTVKLCDFNRISFELHWTVLVLLGTSGFVSLQAGFSLEEAIAVTAGLLCILTVHSLGKVAIVRFLGWEISRVVLLPFGASVSTPSERPLGHHLAVLLGGLSATLALLLTVTHSPLRSALTLPFVGVRETLAGAGAALLLVNLIPLVPFDLGRLVQLAVSRQDPASRKNTFYRFHDLFAALMFIFGLAYGYPIFAVMAVVSLTVATRERYLERAAISAEGHQAHEITIPPKNLVTFQHGTTFSGAQQSLLTTNQQVFPVLLGEQLLGYIYRSQLRSISHQDDNCYLSEIAEREVPCCDPEEPLLHLLLRKDWNARNPLAVVDSDRKFLGMIFRDQLFDFLIVNAHAASATAHRKTPTEKLPPEKDRELDP